MKKKIILLVLLLLPVLLLTGCDNKKVNPQKNIALTDPTFGYETSFEYEDENFTDIKSEKGGASNELTFKSEDLDVEFQMYYTKMSKSSYERTQEARSKQKYYKEYTFGDYKAYGYGEYSSGLYLNILLDVDSTDTAKILFVSIDRLDTDETQIVVDIVDQKLMRFFNSIKVMSVDQ